ncbi:EAL domain-containing protein [Sphingomonas bacterium]|uniref:EAL domain-containing protein n=1 Tax=Sphingomonas bacterium TaxID=1895847 RepID=UPI00157589C5|nr:EAL domain-containing protein [Sphingomonas bacterium]
MPVLLLLSVSAFALVTGLAAGLRLGRGFRRAEVSEDAGSLPPIPPTWEDGLAGDLDAAVSRGQLFLVHQPKTHARTGEVVGMEALVRWLHPEHGLIGPNDFIHIAEARGEIRRITEWVVRQALMEQRSLAICGHPLACSVNISACLLADRDFGAWLLETVRDASAPFGLEITETAMIADSERALANLHSFAKAGLRIAIDDYGAGLSSLAYLKQLPAHELKIDRMFVQGLSSSHRDPLLVRSTIDLAHALGMEVTAEGVESPAAMALLRVMGCDHMQGYLISKPLRLGELRAFLDLRGDRGIPMENITFPWRSVDGKDWIRRRAAGDKE